MVKQFFISICIICQLQAMEVCLPTQQITLVVLPSATYSIRGLKNRPDTHGHMSASLYGFSWEHNKIELLTSHTDKWNFGDCLMDSGRYSPEAISIGLQDKTINGYPLQWHKKIELNNNEELTVVIRNVVHDRSEDNPVLLSDSLKNRLLRYLTYDAADERKNAFNFCYEVALEHAQPGEAINKFSSLITYFSFVAQKDITPGDVIGLFNSKRALDDYGYSSLLELKHYAIALGNDIYLSKLGAGGMLILSSLQSLKDFWECSDHAKIDPSIGKRKNFVKNPFCSIPYRTTTLQIYPHDTIPINNIIAKESLFFMAWLAGLRCTNNQIQLRSSLVIPLILDHQHNCTTPQEVKRFLLAGTAGKYPLHDHKKICYLAGDEIIKLCIVNQDDTMTDINFPEQKKRKLLTYLMHDTEDKIDCCFDFCKFLCLKKFISNKIIGYSYDNQWSCVNEAELQPGDAVALGVSHNIKHWAIALGYNMYLSKIGNGGSLAVTNMPFMMEHFNCKGFVVIKPTITRYKRFWDESQENFDRSSIPFAD